MVQLHYRDNKFSLIEREQFLSYLKQEDCTNGILLKTCNRIEYYTGNGYVSEEIANHLFSVAAGLKSNFIGDTAIQGQVKHSYIKACEEKKANKSLHKLFQHALCVGKKVRSETTISQGAVSYSQAALETLCKNIDSIKNKNITILGVHNINEKIVKCLIKKGAATIFIGNRTLNKAKELAERYNCRAFSFSVLQQRLSNTDILITATSAPHYVVNYEDFPKKKTMFIIDLAVPRDVNETIGLLKGVILVNVEQIEKQVNQNLTARRNEIKKANLIVRKEIERFMKIQEKLYDEKKYKNIIEK